MKYVVSESGLIYDHPEINVLEISPEGVLCASGDEDGGTEGLGENNGSWGTLAW